MTRAFSKFSIRTTQPEILYTHSTQSLGVYCDPGVHCECFVGGHGIKKRRFVSICLKTHAILKGFLIQNKVSAAHTHTHTVCAKVLKALSPASFCTISFLSFLRVCLYSLHGFFFTVVPFVLFFSRLNDFHSL